LARGVVALTRTDLAAGREAAALAALRDALVATPFSTAPIVHVSVATGEGIAELRRTLASELALLPPRPESAAPRLLVETVSHNTTDGCQAAGTVASGLLYSGQEVMVQPAGHPARIHRLHAGGEELRTVRAGRRVRLELAGFAPRPAPHTARVGPGDTISSPDRGNAADAIDVLLVDARRPEPDPPSATGPLADRSPVQLLFANTRGPATAFLHGGGTLAPGGQALAQLRFEHPVFFLGGDRFLVRDPAGSTLLAAGRVLEPNGHRKHWQHRSHRALLEARAAAPDSAAAWVASLLGRDGIAEKTGLLAQSRFGTEEVATALTRLAGEGRVVLAGAFAADSGRWRGWMDRAAAAVDQAHLAHPEWPGLPLAGLEAALGEELPLPGAFQALTASLCEHGFVRTTTTLSRTTHRPALPPQLQATGQWLRAALAERPLEPPALKELVGDRASQRAMQFLLDTGEAVQVGPDLVLAGGAYAQAVEAVRTCLRRQGTATVGELRQAVGCTRRLMVPLCEKLDLEGITQREGDHRRLRGTA
jgi:selenocysteine-specific elongation factor